MVSYNCCIRKLSKSRLAEAIGEVVETADRVITGNDGANHILNEECCDLCDLQKALSRFDELTGGKKG